MSRFVRTSIGLLNSDHILKIADGDAHCSEELGYVVAKVLEDFEVDSVVVPCAAQYYVIGVYEDDASVWRQPIVAWRVTDDDIALPVTCDIIIGKDKAILNPDGTVTGIFEVFETEEDFLAAVLTERSTKETAG